MVLDEGVFARSHGIVVFFGQLNGTPAKYSGGEREGKKGEGRYLHLYSAILFDEKWWLA